MFKFFTSDLRRNLIKILCLSVGIAIGMLLVAKLYFIKTYDTFFPNADRLYLITESVVQNGEYKEYKQIPGGMSPELMRTFPQIEAATRFTVITDEAVIKLEDDRKFDVPYVSLADTCFFDVLSTPIIEGNPHEVLNVTDRVMIPRSLADKIGGDVVGMTFSLVEWSDQYKMTVGGVYEDYPINSTIANAVYLAMPTISNFMYDGSENLLGNDRYKGYAKLNKDAMADDLHPKIVEYLKTKLPEEAFTASDFRIWLRPLSGVYSSDTSVKTMSWLLGMLATVILICAGLNYLLIVIGQLAYRGKEMAIRKCFGTGHPAIFRMMLCESLFFLLISVGIAVLIDFSLSNMSKELLGYDTAQLFALRGVWWLEGLICLVLLIITGILPAVIYCRTPLASAFRPVAFGRKIWKLILLAVQFFAYVMV
ncbi:MAG: ABC transporter permease, partial [Muribaculaceae bacterium]|nr:ABC transporter permease [Muribaculaceae bacterium]